MASGMDVRDMLPVSTALALTPRVNCITNQCTMWVFDGGGAVQQSQDCCDCCADGLSCVGARGYAMSNCRVRGDSLIVICKPAAAPYHSLSRYCTFLILYLLCFTPTNHGTPMGRTQQFVSRFVLWLLHRLFFRPSCLDMHRSCGSDDVALQHAGFVGYIPYWCIPYCIVIIEYHPAVPSLARLPWPCLNLSTVLGILLHWICYHLVHHPRGTISCRARCCRRISRRSHQAVLSCV
jgi:hypothetical protein